MKRGADMTYGELQKLEYLNGVQAAKYCNLSARTFYNRVSENFVKRYRRGAKYFYRRTELDVELNPRAVIDQAAYVISQERKFHRLKNFRR